MQKPSPKTLYLLADNFSSDTIECFFEKELPYICQVFDQVKVLSLYPSDNRQLNYSSPNLEVLRFDYFAPCNRPKVFIRNFHLILYVFCFELIKTHSRSYYLKNFRSLLNYLVISFGAAERLREFIQKDTNSDTVFYSYWFKQWAFALSLIKLREKKLRFVSRIHGGDYDEDQVKSTLPFRYFQLKMVNRIFAVSDYGRNYLMKRFRVAPEKIVTSRLGLETEPTISPYAPGKLNIVSCSSLIPLKRVHLLPGIFRLVKTPLQWVHFGDGQEMEHVKQEAKNLSHHVEFKGYVPNKTFIDYLRNNPVSLFINVSESEGIPVSMMEAISNGIPLAGPAVCGVPEIVTTSTGLLFDVGFDPSEVAAEIERRHLEGQFYTEQTRNKVRDFYKDFFYVKKNHQELAQHLISI